MSSSSYPGGYLSEADQDKLLSYVKKQADNARLSGATRAIIDELIVLLLARAGLKAAEICSLNIEDLLISQGDKAIRINSRGKKAARAVQIAPEMASHVQTFIRRYRKGAEPNAPLLVGERGNRLIYMSLYSKVKRIGKKAGIGKLHPQILRRTFLIGLYDSERDLRFVQEQAGHASHKTTAIYVRAATENKQQASQTSAADRSPSPSTAKSRRGSSVPSQTSPKPPALKPASSCPDSQLANVCEACGKPVAGGATTRIDSGQVLCTDCLREMRRK